jgi:hypothetical protein
MIKRGAGSSTLSIGGGFDAMFAFEVHVCFCHVPVHMCNECMVFELIFIGNSVLN